MGTNSQDILKIVESRHHDPFEILGIHPIKKQSQSQIIIRTFQPKAQSVKVISLNNIGQQWEMNKIHPEGFFELILSDRSDIFPYQYQIKYTSGLEKCIYDPYSFLPIISEFDRFLFNEGNHYRLYEKLGAHIMTVQNIAGVHFAVWAPNAERVSVVGDFNHWDGRSHPMRVLGSSGIWELFIPELNEGNLYKFEIRAKDGAILVKVDPYGFYFEQRPKNAAIIHNIQFYQWNDEDWMEKRTKINLFEKPISIYEVHLGSWKRVLEENNRFMSYRELADTLIPYVKEMGYTHLQLLPIMEHPLDESWGYQVTGYYAPSSRFGTPEDFMYFIDRAHQANLGVILDWVPAHFPKDEWALASYDGTYLYEHSDPRLGEHQDWGTSIFNYGRHEVRAFLISNAVFWLDKYHIDGLRVDAVASMLYLDYSRKAGEWLPNKYGGRENLDAIDFIRTFNEIVHQYYPGVLTVAEESTAFDGVSRPTYLGGLGFSMKWNMGWMNDILNYFSKDPIYRKYYQNNLTFALLYAFHENFILVLSHDEVVHEKGSLLSRMLGYDKDKFNNLRALFGYMYAQPGKKLLFMGAEIGQWNEWNSAIQLDWHLLQWLPHQSLQRYMRDLNHIYISEPALYEIDFYPQGFEWIDFHDADRSIISFIRRAKNPRDYLICIFNFTPVKQNQYRIGVPENIFYEEIFNSDSELYDGFNNGNFGGLQAEQYFWQNQPYSIQATLPPLSAIYFKPKR